MSEHERIADRITMEDLTEEQRQIADIIGLASYVKLISECGGTYIYVPNAKRVTLAARNDQIRADFDGYNYKELAIKYHLTESSIRRITEDEAHAYKTRIPDNQITLI